MHVHVQDLSTVNDLALNKFFNKCKELGYVNNVSHGAIKTDFVLEREGNIWFLLVDDDIISMAGCHRFDEIDPLSFRVLYRGCNLPGLDPWKGMSRMHFNSACYRELLPYSLDYIEEKGYNIANTYVTVNKDSRNHKSMSFLEKHKILRDGVEKTVFYTPQTVYKLDTTVYFYNRAKISCILT